MGRAVLAMLATAAALAAASPAAAAPAIQAHRGGSAIEGVPSFPENTLPAFRNAAREGYVLELDAKLTKDGVPVVIHDATLDRTTVCTGRVDAIKRKQLQDHCRADVLGSPGNGLSTRPTAPTVPVPTLAEVLAFARLEGARVSLEIKNVPTDPDFDSGDGFANAVMNTVIASGFPRARLIVQSFWPANLTVAKSRLPGVATSFLTLAQSNDGGPSFAAANGYQWVSPAWPVSASYVAEAHGMGRRVVPYTLDTASDVRQAASIGTDALISDDPAMAARVLGLSRRELTPDRLRPEVALLAPSYASDHSLGRRFRLRWRGSDRGSGIARYTLEVRRSTNVPSRWRTLRARTTRTVASFRGRASVGYLFRVRARDRFGNLSRYAYDKTVVPRDDRSGRLRFSPGWERIRRSGAWGRTLTRGRHAGLSMELGFRGERVTVIGRRVPRGGLLLVTLDGRSRAVRLRGRDRYRRLVFRSRRLLPGRHRLVLHTLGGGIVDLDAVAIDTGPPPPRRSALGEG
jgi:glycerophosphoryl diester phosphodiesterase